MRNAAMPKTELLEVELSLIDVEEGFNARTAFDPDELQGLSETVGDFGIFQNLVLRPSSGGRYTIVAGERRYRGAKAANVRKVPALVGDLSKRDALLISFIENQHRSALNPIEQAQGVKAVAEEFELTSRKEIAAKVRLKAKEVGLLLRLLDLPEGVQRLIASGDAPTGAEKRLREVAKVSPRAAECVCEYAKRKGIKGREFVSGFDGLIRATASARFTDPPTLINIWRPALSELVADKKVLRELEGRINAAEGREIEDPALRFGEEEEMAARAAGCLLEPAPSKSYHGRADTYITDPEFAADLAMRFVENIEGAARERREAAEKAAKARAEKGEDGESEEDKQAAERRAQNAERREEKENALLFNDELGVNLMKHRGGKARKQRSLARGKAIAKLLLAQNPELAARGLRLVFAGLREVEQKKLKSGKLGKAKIIYATTAECIEFLNRRIDEARTDAELHEVLAEALVAGIEADHTATTKAERVYWSPASSQVETLLAEDIKEVRPRRRRVKRGK